MSTWVSRLARVALVLACVWRLPQSVSAQQQVGSPSALPSSDYDEVLRAAEAALQAQDFAKSRALFARAHALKPTARTLRGIGSAAFSLKAYDEAVVQLEQALASAAEPLDAGVRKETRALLERAYGFVGRYMVGLAPASAQLWVDQTQTALRTGDRLLLSIGQHALEARASGYRVEQRTIEVAGGEDVGLNFSLQPTATIATPAQAAQTVASGEADHSQSSRFTGERQPGRPLYKNAWLWTGVGVALAAVAVTVGMLAARDRTSVGAVSASPNTPLGGTISAPLRSR